MLLLGNRLRSVHSNNRPSETPLSGSTEKKIDAYYGRKVAEGGGGSDTSGKELEHV